MEPQSYLNTGSMDSAIPILISLSKVCSTTRSSKLSMTWSISLTMSTSQCQGAIRLPQPRLLGFLSEEATRVSSAPLVRMILTTHMIIRCLDELDNSQVSLMAHLCPAAFNLNFAVNLEFSTLVMHLLPWLKLSCKFLHAVFFSLKLCPSEIFGNISTLSVLICQRTAPRMFKQ